MTELPTDSEGAMALLMQHVNQPNLIKHCIATEAIMRRLAEKLGADEELWAMIGLLHDLDFEKTKETPSLHTKIATQILEEEGFSPEFTRAIRSHNEQVDGWERSEPVDYALTAAESVTGLIVAAALVRPEKEDRLVHVKVSSLKKRMREKAFARNVNRDSVRECEKLGLSLDEFLELALDAMRAIGGELGL
ncbi:MAG: HDIG domain-containing metalloprotein [Candidatus Glassbacteria bacterium]